MLGDITKYKDLDSWMKYYLGKRQYLTIDKVWMLYYKENEETLLTKWGDFIKYINLDCWKKYYVDSALKESVGT